MPSAKSTFERSLDRRLHRLVSSGVVSRLQLLDDLWGLYPAELEKAIVRIGASIPQNQNGDDIVVGNRSPLGVIPLDHLEHPLDFAWYFTNDALDKIFNALSNNVSKGASVACLGCPSVYIRGIKELNEYQFKLFDTQPRTRDLSVPNCVPLNLLVENVPPSKFDAIILDPPWYNAYYKWFIVHAIPTLNDGAIIILSFPPAGTRVSAKRDFLTFSKWLKKIGFVLVEKQRMALPYRTPFFEIAALRESGVKTIPLSWRCGDLLIFRLQKVERHPIVQQPIITNGSEVQIGLVRIRLLGNDKPKIRSYIKRLHSGNALASVSSRHPIRRNANVVTSGNSYLKTNAPEQLAAVLMLAKCTPTTFDRERVLAWGKRNNRRIKGLLQFSRTIVQEHADGVSHLLRLKNLNGKAHK